jgi:hypothetical protein
MKGSPIKIGRYFLLTKKIMVFSLKRTESVVVSLQPIDLIDDHF